MQLVRIYQCKRLLMCEAYTTALEMHVLKKAAVYYDFITEAFSEFYDNVVLIISIVAFELKMDSLFNAAF